jgi:hypothetical protein
VEDSTTKPDGTGDTSDTTEVSSSEQVAFGPFYLKQSHAERGPGPDGSVLEVHFFTLVDPALPDAHITLPGSDGNQPILIASVPIVVKPPSKVLQPWKRPRKN